MSPLSLPKEIFGAKVNMALMAQAVRVYESNQRKARAKTKTRAEVVGSGKKIWRQKGTGRARHGDQYAPIFVGGGIAHGPTGGQNFKLKMSKKMKKLALFSALTLKLKEESLSAVRGLLKIEAKTKKMSDFLKKSKINLEKTSVLIIAPRRVKNLTLACRNLTKLTLLPVNSLNIFAILKNKKIILIEESINELKKIHLEK